LVLKGPAGAGKTATIMTLAKALDMDVVEWRNPKDSQFSSEGYLSMLAQFEDFLGRSGKFGSLEFGSRVSDGNIVSTTEISIEVPSRRKVILLEEFPNTFTSSSTAAISFRKSLLNYLAANPPSFTSSRHHRQNENHAPIVMIITESLLAAGTSSDDIFSAHRLLGPDILGHTSASVIEFNSMASTFMIKALDLVIKKEARQSGRRRVPGLSVLKKLGETGDIRSAIAALEFLCLRGNDEDDWGGSVASRAKKGINSSSNFTKLERDSLENIMRRETSLGIFHAVGKVVYNKREEVPSTHLLPEPKPPPQPPDHMAQHTRLQTSVVSPDELIGSTGTDTQTFVAALHENYVSSCEGISFIDSLNGCLEALSDTDVLGSNRGLGFVPGGWGGSRRGASDSLRQDEIGFHLAVRGILFALPSPVARSISLPGVPRRSGGKGDAFKMFYPTSLKLWKKTEEVESLVDRWTRRYEAGFPSLERSSNKSQSWATLTKGIEGPGNFPEARGNDDCNSLPHQASLLCQNKSASRVELILETLPYLTQIERCKSTSFQLEELQKITEFSGLDQLSDEVFDNEDVVSALDHHVNITTAHESSTNAMVQQPGLAPKFSGEPEIEKLWLSDDDIEDD
jgi:cell cycle checkpoint protein